MQKFKKNCSKCNNRNTKKDGKRRGRQSYKCNSCNYVWITKSRRRKDNLAKKLYYLYAIQKQTYSNITFSSKSHLRKHITKKPNQELENSRFTN